MDQWTFTPTYKATSAGVRVDSILAIREPAGVTGQNIIAVWYVRPAVGCTGWTAKAWESADQWEAVKHVKSELSIPDEEDAYWGTYTAKPTTIAVNAGVDYEKGFASADPLATALANDPTRDWVMEALTASGYKVADNPIDKAPPDGCKAEEWLCAMAESAEHANTSSFSGDWTVPFMTQAAACAAVAAAPPVPSAIGGWGTWACTTPGNFEYSHATGGVCFYKRVQECTSCRTITFPPVPPATANTTQTQCVYYYCTDTCSGGVPNPNGSCPPPGTAGCLNSTPFDPDSTQPATPVGPSPSIPHVPQDHPNTMPVCTGGTKPWN
ncbi:MAG TPA: hypothetical protein VEB22_07495 [Phycisphaerales bacterium]|nr:hypothetical protein [Phycisphaerales bacterium]